MYTNILVPLDGSDTSRRGLREAIALASTTKATVRLLHVVSDFTPTVDMVSIAELAIFRSGLHQYGQRLLATAAAEVRGADLEVSTALREPERGRVADAIVAEAREARCDLVVLGTHGRRGFQRALMGSDAELVVRESPVPVLVVRAAGAAS